jgi:hypothetical protein
MFQVFHMSFLDVSSVDRVLHMDARVKREVARAVPARAMFGRRGPPRGHVRRRHERAMSGRHRPMCGHDRGCPGASSAVLLSDPSLPKHLDTSNCFLFNPYWLVASQGFGLPAVTKNQIKLIGRKRQNLVENFET